MSRLHTALAACLVAGLAAPPVATPASAETCPQPGRVAVGVAPPPALPREIQPPIPGYGYLWTPGAWAWNGAVNDYYWTPGVWVRPPSVGLLWTPGYWAWNDGVYLFNFGYWGSNIGFYGGVDYGYGYYGHGYQGGYWQGRTFYYNRAVNRFGDQRFNAVYDRPAPGGFGSRVSYAGGRGGVRAQPTSAESAAAREAHTGATPEQSAHGQRSALEPGLRAGVNHGHPALVALAAVGAGYGAARLAGHMAATHAARHAGGQAAEVRGQPRGLSQGRPETAARRSGAFGEPRRAAEATRSSFGGAGHGGGHPGGGGGRPESAFHPAASHQSAPRPSGGEGGGGGHPGGGEHRR